MNSALKHQSYTGIALTSENNLELFLTQANEAFTQFFYMVTNTPKLPQLSQGKGQKFMFYIHRFRKVGKKKAKKIFNVTVLTIPFIWNPKNCILICVEFLSNTFLTKANAVLNPMALTARGLHLMNLPGPHGEGKTDGLCRAVPLRSAP